MTRTEQGWDRKTSAGKNDTIDELTKSPLRVLPATVPERTHALHIGQVIPVMTLWRAATVSIFRRVRGDPTPHLTLE